MRRIPLLFLAFGGLLAGVFGAAAADVSVYSSVNDKKACKFKEIKGGNEPDSCEYRCEGPVAGVRTKLLSCYDYEHLFVQVDGKSYSTWGPMVAVGSFSGIANKNGMVEWVFAGGGKSRADLKGLIVRFQGTDSETNKSRNALAVFSLKAGQICWKGNYPANEAARAAVDGAACQSPLTEEGK